MYIQCTLNFPRIQRCNQWGKILLYFIKTWPRTVPVSKNLVTSATGDNWVTITGLCIGIDDFIASCVAVPKHLYIEIHVLLSITWPLFCLYIVWLIWNHFIDFSSCYFFLGLISILYLLSFSRLNVPFPNSLSRKSHFLKLIEHWGKKEASTWLNYPLKLFRSRVPGVA